MLTAVVYATEGSLSWLGSKPIVCWVLATLCEVRGVDRVVLLVPPNTVIPAVDGVTVIAVDKPPMTLTALAEAAGLSAGSALLEVHAGAVFLRAETIELAVSAVLNDGKSSAVTVSRFNKVLERQGTTFRTVSNAVVETKGCRVLADFTAAVSEDFLNRGGSPVEVLGLESIDAITPDGTRMARALVETGRVY